MNLYATRLGPKAHRADDLRAELRQVDALVPRDETPSSLRLTSRRSRVIRSSERAADRISSASPWLRSSRAETPRICSHHDRGKRVLEVVDHEAREILLLTREDERGSFPSSRRARCSSACSRLTSLRSMTLPMCRDSRDTMTAAIPTESVARTAATTAGLLQGDLATRIASQPCRSVISTAAGTKARWRRARTDVPKKERTGHDAEPADVSSATPVARNANPVVRARGITDPRRGAVSRRGIRGRSRSLPRTRQAQGDHALAPP